MRLQLVLATALLASGLGVIAGPAAAQEQYICPLYPYAFHGSYCSYYALQYPGCVQPSSFDGPIGLAASCDGRPDCELKIQVEKAVPKEVPERAAILRQDNGNNSVHSDTWKNGLKTFPNGTLLSPGVTPANGYQSGRKIRFDLPETGRTIRARVFFCTIDPSKFDTPDPNRYKNPETGEYFPTVEAGIGYEVNDLGGLPITSDIVTISEGRVYQLTAFRKTFQVIVRPADE